MTNDTKRTAPPAVAAEVILDTPTIGQSPNDTLQLTFADGRLLNVQVGDLSPTIIAQATMHGLKQKLVDAAAISRDPDTGRTATIETKFAAVKEVYDRLLSGSWNKARGDGTGAGGLLFKALCRMYDSKTPDQIKEFLAGKSKEEQAALRRNPKVAAIIEQIKAESVDTDGVDSDAILGELDD